MKLSVKNITASQWINIVAVAIIVTCLLIYIFRKVPVPEVTERERQLREELNAAVQEHQRVEAERIKDSTIRAAEIESLQIDNQEIRSKLKNLRNEYEKKINGLRNATPAELERFFSDRYE